MNLKIEIDAGKSTSQTRVNLARALHVVAMLETPERNTVRMAGAMAGLFAYVGGSHVAFHAAENGPRIALITADGEDWL